jgi:two-component sensor histidine kinase
MPRTPSGIDAIGELTWGAHFCHFYQTRDDLAQSLVPYFKAGLEHRERCMWVTADPFGVEDAKDALRAAVPDLERRERSGQIEIVDHRDWYLRQGRLSPDEVVRGWIQRAEGAVADGYRGLRLTGNTFWLEQHDWHDFAAYEAKVNAGFLCRPVVALCSYCLDRCAPANVLDVVRNHQFALARRHGGWEVIEDASAKLARAELERLNGELEARVRQRTAELERTLGDKEALLREVHHRVRNNLQIITSLMRLKLAQPRGPELESALVDMLSRVETISLVHQTLYERGRVALVPVAEYLAQLCERLERLHDGQGRTFVEVAADELDLPLKAVLALGFITSELVGNALRHAFPGGRGGRIVVAFTAAQDGFVLSVRDDGIGLDERQTARPASGGLALVHSFARQLGGSLAFRTSGGTEVVVTAPLGSP